MLHCLPFDMRFVNLEDWRSAGFNPRIVNLYGPCEATNDVFFHEVQDILEDPADVPIGLPVPGHVSGVDWDDDTQRYIVNGRCVSHGYLGYGPFRQDGGDLLTDHIECKGGVWYFRWRCEDSDVKMAGYRVNVNSLLCSLRTHFNASVLLKGDCIFVESDDVDKLDCWKASCTLPTPCLVHIQTASMCLGRTGKSTPKQLLEVSESIAHRMCEVIQPLFKVKVLPIDDLTITLNSQRIVQLVDTWRRKLKVYISVADVYRTRTISGCLLNKSRYFEYDVMRVRLSPMFGITHLGLKFERDEGSYITLSSPQ